MTADEYRGELIKAYLLARCLVTLPLKQMAEAIQHADAVVPLLDPTLWIRKEKAMHEDEQVNQALLKAKEALVELGVKPS